MRPQHFQQHDRYLESYVEGRVRHARPYNWGLTSLTLETDLLNLGKLAIATCSGVLPDGTPFAIPGDEPAPPALEVPSDTRGAIVYLALPHRRSGGLEVDVADSGESMARYRIAELDVGDSNVSGGAASLVQVARLRLDLVVENDRLADHALIGIARIVERQADGRLVLDNDYIAPCLSCKASPRLSGYLDEITGLLHQRGEALAGRVTASGRGGAAEIAEFLTLQAVNRYEALFRHLAKTHELHPETFYQYALQAAGELTTFLPKRRPALYPDYRHDALQQTFAAVMDELREALGTIIEPTAIPIPLTKRRYGMWSAKVAEKSLFETASFVLAASADVSDEKIRKHFPAQTKIGPPDYIRQMVQAALPGIAIRPLAAAPRQIPFHAGFTYFELDRGSEYWSKLEAGFAIHCSGDFPGLQMEFWAIRG